jgi:SAM-dependent methyltransferase
MSENQDHFSSVAGHYARGRFGYPAGLFDYLAGLCGSCELAWDCATGSGQAAAALAARFERVVATDISADLLGLAPVIPNVTYRLAPAEASELAPTSVDLVTVAQALHWFDQERFWAELRRVCRPGAIFAFWGYLWPKVDDAVDAHLMELRSVLESYWPERAGILQREYREVNPPFAALKPPPFTVQADWRRADYLAHIASWSAVRYHRERQGGDILAGFDQGLQGTWPGHEVRRVTWPLVLRVHRVA